MGESVQVLWREKVKSEWKVAFFTAIIMGFLIHAYKFLNTLPNHDSLYNYYSDQNMLASGRWLLSIVCGLSSYFDLPWIIGLLSLVFLGLTTVVIVEIFQVKNPILIGIIGGLLVAFPSITETFFFGFTADGYFLAMLLASLAVAFSSFRDKKKWHVVIATICVCCACGIYQSYVSYAMLLAICYFLWILLSTECTMKECFKWIGRQLIIYVGGLTSFYVIWKICMMVQNVQANSNQGVDQLQLSLSTVLSAIPQSIYNMVFFFLEWNVMENGWTLYGILNVIFLVCFAILFVVVIYKSMLWKRKGNLLLVFLCVVAIPFVASMWCFATPSIQYRPMMLAGVVFLYILFAILANNYLTNKMSTIVGFLLAFIIFNNGIIANISYFYMNKSYEATYAVGQEMVERIHVLDVEKKEIAVIGSRLKDVSLDNTAHGKKIHMLGQLLESDMLFDDAHVVNFLKNTFDEDICSVESEILETLKDSKEVKEMGVWPSSDSVKEIDGTIVIKISETNEE